MMSLADDIRELRGRALAELTAAHDYYGETSVAWSLIQELIRGGREFTITSHVTGTCTTHEELLAKSYLYVFGQLHEATFQQFITLFESFIFDFLRLWLTAFPQSLGKNQLDFKTILDAPDKEAVTRMVVEKEVNGVLYGRPSEWFVYLETKAKLGCPTSDEIAQLSEAKATRDVLVHNRGIVNAVYAQKAGPLARFPTGERIEISERYHRQTWNLLRKIVADLSDAAIAKVS